MSLRVREGSDRQHRRTFGAAAAAILIAAALPALASAHLERPSYWPDPAPDRSVSPPAGGKVPTVRSLASALTGAGPGEVRVACQRTKSMKLARRSIRTARRHGYRLRPSQPVRRLSAKRARGLIRLNRVLFSRCKFRSIQAAVNASGNNDRIVIMPGRYTEPRSRSAPTNDPRCKSLLQHDRGGSLTPSYEYQATCPNDQNLVYVQGRAIRGQPLESPDPDRHGIPARELGRCVRCNLQIEGSGARPEDVLIDAGEGYRNPLRPGAKPGGHAKHVVMRTDRSDGFVGRNFLLRGALEHGFYTEETDGVLLDRVKFFWNADYGHLSFTTDHNEVRNCEGMGAGDAAVYPGASPQTGDFRDEAFYPRKRFNTVIKNCDLHGSALGYSGSMGNSVRMTHNHIYGNVTGIASDTLSAAGHPGFPADGMQIDNNYIYSNNLQLYRDNAPVKALVGVPIGTGVIWAGMNGAVLKQNWIFDNWRHGTVLLAVPDALTSEPEGNVDSDIACTSKPPSAISSTSCGNRYFGNRMGRVPPGFTPHAGVNLFGNAHGTYSANSLPNGVDYWWDEFPGNNGNCWFANTGTDGTAGSVTGSGSGVPPDLLPDCANGASPALSVGNGDVVKEAVLLDCSMWSRGNTAEDHPACNWFSTPARPSSRAFARQQQQVADVAASFAASPEGEALRDRLDEILSGQGGDRRCARGLMPLTPFGSACASNPRSAPADLGQAVGTVTAGSVAQLADCSDWNGASGNERPATIADIRGQINTEGGTVWTPSLSDAEAAGVFDRACADEFAQGFRLYVIYSRAAGFLGLIR